jgi:hypothetical protein
MRFKQTWQLYKVIPMKHKSVLPDLGFGHILADIGYSQPFHVTLYCKPKVIHPNPSWRNKSSKHRVIAICHCGRHVPFGRMGQHYKPECSTC